MFGKYLLCVSKWDSLKDVFERAIVSSYIVILDFTFCRPSGGVETACTQSDRTTEPGDKHLQSSPLKNTPRTFQAVT